MARPPTLTEEQQEFIAEHIALFPATIRDHPDWPGPRVKREIVGAYARRLKQIIEPADTESLADHLRRHIDLYGLPSRFHGRAGVTGYIEYLRKG